MVLVPFVVNPLQSLWRSHSTMLIIETIQRAQRAVLILRGFYIALTGLRPSPAAPGTDVPRTLGTTYYALRICCLAPAKRMWPAGLIASTASGVEYQELTHAETQRRKGRKNSGIFTTKGRSESREWDFQSAEICANRRTSYSLWIL